MFPKKLVGMALLSCQRTFKVCQQFCASAKVEFLFILMQTTTSKGFILLFILFFGLSKMAKLKRFDRYEIHYRDVHGV